MDFLIDPNNSNSPNNLKYLSSSNNPKRLFNPSNLCTPVNNSKKPDHMITRCCLEMKRSVRLASGGQDGKVFIWSTYSKGLRVEYDLDVSPHSHSSAVTCVRYSPDGCRLASASREHVLIHTVGTKGKYPFPLSKVATVRLDCPSTSRVAFQPDGTLIACTGTYPPIIIIAMSR